MTDARHQAAISLWHRFANSSVEEWDDETHKAEYLDAIDGLTTGWLFNLLLSRVNFDGMDPKTFSLSELQGAIVGAEWPSDRPPFVECEYPNCKCPRYGRCGNATDER